ncbi:MAG: RdgB/HAM1 family non-canonical purine NTP pyrophosphatase [Gammaproteobacteria bacterium]|nr:RdgB/HAM1 family non-canonical purine NTP pyrophosphatase [Gammaproteobacteria bacterium]
MQETKKIVLASSNSGKLREFEALFQGTGWQIVPQGQYQVSDAEEIGLTFIENALLKARHASQVTGLPAIADDSGVVVDALGGAPGIYSARYAGTHGDREANCAKLLTAMADVPQGQRHARFYCCLVYLRNAQDPMPLIAQATLEGEIVTTPRGENGYGYDPLLWLPERGCTVAELSATEKNQISHRGKALQQLLQLMQKTTQS